MMIQEVPSRVVERILTHIRRDDGTGCWIWLRSYSPSGYGRVAWHENGMPIYTSTHRALFIATYGRIPDGLDLDHLCRNRACCNPAHLEPVTRQVNLLRGETVPAARAARTQCPQGHPYTPENTYTSAKGQRRCRECGRIQNRAYLRARRAARTAA